MLYLLPTLLALAIVAAYARSRAQAPRPARAPPGMERQKSFPDDPVLQRLADAGALVDTDAYSNNNFADRYTTITFEKNALDNDLFSQLRNIKRLRYLILVSCTFEAGALAGLHQISQPLAIQFQDCKLTPGNLVDLDDATCIEKVRFLGMDLDDDLFAGVTALPNLRGFTAGGRGLTSAGLRFLRNSPHLTELVLGDTSLDDASLKEVCGDHDLVILGVAGTGISDEATRTIAKYTHLSELFVNYCRIGDKGVARFASLKGLRLLNLDGTDVTDEGIGYIAQLRNLETLGLARTKVTIAGVSKLVGMPRLRTIGNRGSGFSAAEVKSVFGRSLTTD